MSRTGLDPTIPEDVHNAVAHTYSPQETYLNESIPGNKDSWLPLAKQNKYCNSKVARLMQRLSEFGVLDFGHGLAGTVSLALWRDTATSAAVVSELGFQLKFERLDQQTQARLEPIEAFFRSVQHHIAPWVLLGTTKTNLVYRRRGREVANRE